MFATAAWLLWVLTRQANADALAPTLALLILITLGIWTHRRVSKKSIKNILYILCAISIYYCITLIIHSTNETSTKTSQNATKADALVFDSATLAQLRSEGVPVFVNATADWCLTCKVNELSTLSREEITTHFTQQHIRYMVADWTNRDDAITQFLKEHQRQGVPTYVFYPPHAQPIILPQILSVDTVKTMTCVNNCAAQ
jgi:thiol:disulfide interchange protein